VKPADLRRARPWDSWSARGIVVDLDGVLLSSTEARRAQWRWWADRVGADAVEVAAFAAGRRPADVVASFAPDRDPHAERAAVRRRGELLLRACQRPAGVRGFVRALPEERFAVVTGLDGAEARAHLARARLSTPAVLVTGDEVTAGRPEPEGHLRAGQRLGIEPHALIAIESTGVGLDAAAAVGMTPLLVGSPPDPTRGRSAAVHVGDLSRLHVILGSDGVTLQATREPARWP